VFFVILTATPLTQSQPTITQRENNFCDYSSTLTNEVLMLRAKLEAMEEALLFNTEGI